MSRPRPNPHRAFDPHRILGVRDDATPDEIRRAFRAAALRHHPDRNPGDPHAARRFRDARAAYETLMRMHDGTPRERTRADRPLRVRCVLVGVDLVGIIPEALREPGRWIALELLAARTCPACLGEGGEHVARSFFRTERVECGACDGVGLVRVERRLRVRVPVVPARALRLRGRGVAIGAHRGDAILEIA
ncbi:DnaJ domain-containing protein [Sandaracinus amylolyticus]|uniref:DnaJ domain-containing protein n=1 Tax=Sandaracinus amylolyticus TaxID=927083 RepID=UPI001F331A15|nr:DnaJ domain-containing protein [Sandaracinus amylolyticus]UJR81329.1 Chaperone protein DnaJ [Sandaracinus amylolyticus]